MSFFHYLLSGITCTVVGFGMVKMMIAARKALKETQVTNRRFVDSLKAAANQNLKLVVKLKETRDKDNNKVITFEIDNHLFKISLNHDHTFLTCTGFHREHYQQVLFFNHHFATGKTQKRISTHIIHDEEKDILYIDQFISSVKTTDWVNLLNTSETLEKKDYTLVNGSITKTDTDGSFEGTQTSLPKIDLHPYLLTIKEEIKHLPSTVIRDSYEKILVDIDFLLSSKFELDSERQHVIERIVKKELLTIHHNYIQLSPKSQQECEEAVRKSLETIQNYTRILIEEKEKRHLTNIKKQLRLNEENYKK